MPDPQNSVQASPAVWVGGQRRKLVRKNRSGAGLPRSNTMPSLHTGLTAPASVTSTSSVDSIYPKDKQAEDRFERHKPSNAKSPNSREAKIPSYSPSTAARTKATSMSFPETPRLTKTNSRKKQNLFGSKKPKALDRHPPPIVTSPLPVSTPSKAARFFGVDTGFATTASSDCTQHPQGGLVDDAQDKALHRPVVHPLSLSTRSNLSSEQQAWFGDEALKLAQPQLTSADEAASPTKGFRMLIPESAYPTPSLADQNEAVPTRFSFQGRDDNGSLGLNESRFEFSRSHGPAASRPVPPIPKRNRMRRGTLKSLERMSPITEASTESLRPAFRNGETIAELGVITEHESDEALNTIPVLHKFYSETMLKPNFELDKNDLSPTDHYHDDEASASEEEIDEGAVHPGTKVDLKRARRQNDNVFRFRSPLQSAEDAYLDATEEEMRLEARRITLARLENEKYAIDVKVERLRREQEKMQLQFSTYQASAISNQQLVPARNVCSKSNSENSMLSHSNIGSDEEPTVHKAELVDFIRVTPGMVKLVQITPRKKKMPASHINSGIPISDRYTLVEHVKKTVENVPLPLNSGEAMVKHPISPTPPAKSSKRPQALQKHQCISSGHIFHPIDLRKIPDDAVINGLEVRPYLQTYTGIRQHVKVPVLCEKCNEDCDENVWECEIATCRMAVCQNCAEDMNMEWRERALNSWKLY